MGRSMAGWALAAYMAAPAGGQELPARDRMLELPMEEVFSVGAFDGELWETFGDVRQVAFDDTGNLYVLDADNFRVVVVDPRGGFVREFGRQGEGPGEWRSPGYMSVFGDGTVVLSDVGHRAYQVFGPDGEYRRSIPFENTGGVIVMGRLWPGPDGRSLLTAQAGGMRMALVAGSGAAPEPGRPISRISLEDGTTTPLYRAWEPPAEAGASPQVVQSGGATRFRLGGAGPRIFEPGLHVGVVPGGGFAVIDSSAYVVKMVDASGRETGRITRPSLRPTPVTPRIEERERERRIAEVEAGEGPRMQMVIRGAGGQDLSPSADQMRQMQIDRIREQGFYPEIPVLEGLGVSRDGTLWIQRAGSNGEPGAIDVVTRDGTYRGTLEAGTLPIPAAFGPGGRAAWIERDELDVASVKVRLLPTEIR